MHSPIGQPGVLILLYLHNEGVFTLLAVTGMVGEAPGDAGILHTLWQEQEIHRLTLTVSSICQLASKQSFLNLPDKRSCLVVHTILAKILDFLPKRRRCLRVYKNKVSFCIRVFENRVKFFRDS